MRVATIALLLLGLALSCAPGGPSIESEPITLHARLAPDAQRLRALDDEIAARTAPILQIESNETAIPSELPDRRIATLTRTPKPRALETPPSQQPDDDPYADLEDETPFVPDLVLPPLRPWSPPPLVPRAARERPAPLQASGLAIARDVALGIGAAGLMVSAVSIAADIDSSSQRGEMVGGVALGIGFVGLMTAGILTLTEANQENATVRVRPSARVSGLEISF